MIECKDVSGEHATMHGLCAYGVNVEGPHAVVFFLRSILTFVGCEINERLKYPGKGRMRASPMCFQLGAVAAEALQD